MCFRCSPGYHMSGGLCQDIDECVASPCLHGGTCYNGRPGYVCVCSPGHSGQHCEYSSPTNPTHALLAPATIAIITISIILIGNLIRFFFHFYVKIQ